MNASLFAAAPANIALIKYMGKIEGTARNIPANGSLSLTLSTLRTEIELRPVREGAPFQWRASLPAGLTDPAARVPDLSSEGVERYLAHAERVASRATELLRSEGLEPARIATCWEIRTANTFPSDSGIASSASSFAALTLAVFLARAHAPALAHDRVMRSETLRRELARISREGSGSSCRSFDGPWVEWMGQEARPIESAMPPMADLVLLVAGGKKPVSSSEAHRRVMTSPLWQGRVERADARLSRLRAALASGDRCAVATTSWEEFMEMHELFHTAREPFSYWQDGTREALRALEPLVRSGDRPPIVTMDAGPNVHVLVPLDEREEWEGRLRKLLPALPILGDVEGRGAR